MTCNLGQTTSLYSLLMESHIPSSLALIAVTIVTIPLSYWLGLQSKRQSKNVSNRCVGTPNVQVSHKSVGEPLVTRDKEVNASTCCEAGVPQFLLPLSSSLEPPPEVDIEDEMEEPYVKACKSEFDEEELVTAIKYLNTLRGGIHAHRNSDKLMQALEHIKNMQSRLDNSGSVMEYSYEELHLILVERMDYPIKDLNKIVEEFRQKYGYPPSPAEFIEFHDKKKEELEINLKRSQRIAEETTLEKEMIIVQNQQALQQKDQALQQKDQALQQKDQQHQRALQQKDQTIQQKNRIIQQMSEQQDRLMQRLRELEQGELQRRLLELEEHFFCKICKVEEVQVSLSPCNHLICQRCLPRLSQRKCPMCRKWIQDTNKIYFA